MKRLNSIKEMGVSPDFIKMDKDIGQIKASQNVWPATTVSLCLWHVLRAIKKRLETVKSPRQVVLVEYVQLKSE